MRKGLLGFVAGCIVGPTAALADPTFECGMNASSQIEIGACVNEMLATVDQTLEVALGFAMESAKALDEATEREEAAPALEASQTAWAEFRDNHCNYVGATFGGGSGTGIGIASCRVELGRERIKTLLSLVQ